ncbi:MAG: hypothetical protein QXM16_01780 [Nitrososphaerota archaeon]
MDADEYRRYLEELAEKKTEEEMRKTHMHKERVLLALDCWKKVFTLKTLGGGYVRCFLLFGEEGFTAVETSDR